MLCDPQFEVYFLFQDLLLVAGPNLLVDFASALSLVGHTLVSSVIISANVC